MTERKIVVVAGGSSGIGLSLISVLEKQNYFIFNLDRNEHPDSTENVQTLLADLKSIDDLKQALTTIPDSIDGLVITAGIGYTTRWNSQTPSNFQEELQTNLNITFNLCHAFNNRLKDGSSIVTVSSISGLGGSGMSVGYATAKAGIIGLTKSLAYELAKNKVRVNCVAPGPVNTPLFCSITSATEKRLLENCTPLKRIAEPDDVAEVIEFLLSEKSRFITGQVITIDGGLSMSYKPAL